MRFILSKKGIDISKISCPICDYGVEDINHLFLTCSVAKAMMVKVLAW